MTHKKNKKYSKKNRKIKKNKKTKYSIKKNKQKQMGGNEFLKGFLNPFKNNINTIRNFIKVPLDLIHSQIQVLAEKSKELSPKENRENVQIIINTIKPYIDGISKISGESIGRVLKQAITVSGILPVFEASIGTLQNMIQIIKDTKIMEKIEPMINKIIHIMNGIIDRIGGNYKDIDATT